MKKYFLILCFLTLSWQGQAAIKGTNCAFLIKNLFHAKESQLKNAELTKVQTIVKKYGISKEKTSRWSSYTDVLDDSFKHVAKKHEKTGVEASEEMAKLGKDLRKVYAKSVSGDELKELDYLLARNVLDLEVFRPSEFKEVDSFILSQNKNSIHLNHTQYKKYVKSYVRGTNLYKNAESEGGLLSREDIRDILTYNLWPVYMKPHDIKHVHYGISHPMAMAVVLKSQRSKNHLRSIMMAALFEGIELVQYSEESAICRYMAEELGLNLEEALVYLARATDADLEKILDGTGYRSTFQSLADSYIDYAPKKAGNFQGKAVSGDSLEQELDKMIQLLKSYENESGIDDVMTYKIDPSFDENPDPDVINF